MDLAYKSLLMALFMKEILLRARDTGRENISSHLGLSIMETFITERCMERDILSLLIKANTEETFRIINITEKGMKK